MIDENFLELSWLFGGLAMLVASPLPNQLGRIASSTIFVIFVIQTGMRPSDFNSDTLNYYVHFKTSLEGMQTLVDNVRLTGSWFEPGYQLIVNIFATLTSSFEVYLFIVACVTGLIFFANFIYFKFDAAIIFFFYCTLLLVYSTTTLRIFIASAFLFTATNLSLNGRSGLAMYLSSAGIHYSTLPALLLNAWNSFAGGKIWKSRLYAVLMLVLLIAIAFHFELVEFLVEKVIDRSSSEVQSVGLRNIVLILIVLFALGLPNRFDASRIDSVLLACFLVALIIPFFGLYGLNRIVSVFQLVALGYLNYYWDRANYFCRGFLWVCGFLSLIFFYNVHSLS